MAQSDDGAAVYFLFGLVALWFFAPDSWTNALWYGVKYQVGFDKVQTSTKPKDCDFMHAPLGDKGCSYKAHVKAYNASGALVSGEDAPKYGRDSKTGSSIISYNDGKTWDWYAGDVPDPKVASVVVFWLKE
ncbi:hypothetical protein ACNJX9_11255 [Bradyrhizobium sp. DASA03076]|uniref:hypothetical protein n=1 Tax=Bradyrhizobium sp. BLXBL-03 TaxID=3395916 RepID=UPI003F70337A